MSERGERTRILLVDDHAMMRAGFRMILDVEPDLEVVGEAGSGAEAIEAAVRLEPDVICMDVQMPGLDGIEATRRLAAAHAAARVLIVTTFDRDDYLFAALEAGASGFLLKNAGPEQLVHAVRVIASGEALLAPEATRRVVARFAAGGDIDQRGDRPTTGEREATGMRAAPHAGEPRRTQTQDAPPTGVRAEPTGDPLTDRETEVLALMADALSNAEIAERLFIGEATVKTHVSNVLRKLDARDRVQAIVTAYRSGLV